MDPPALVHLTRCGSTNAVAAAWVRGGGPLPVVVSSATQTAGRGQWGRRWLSPTGGCWFTLALAGAVDAEDLPLRAAAAVRGGVLGVTGLTGVEVVPPNDLLVSGRKAAGLLCERLALAGGGTATLVGVGINANAAPPPRDGATGEALRRPATSLAAELGHAVDPRPLRDACVARLLETLR